MMTTTINLKPQVKNNNANGREELTNVYYRINVAAYTKNLYIYTAEANEESKNATEAFYKECIAMLEGEGWHLWRAYGNGAAPEMRKDNQSLYCHPQSISGNVKSEDVEKIADKIKHLQSCTWEGIDVYGNTIVTTSVEDTLQLYHENYDATIQDILREMFSTKRKNLYFSLEGRIENVANRIAIKVSNRLFNSIDYTESERPYGRLMGESVCAAYIRESITKCINSGYMVTTKQDNIVYARWINKTEERELNRNRRYA